MHSVDSKRSGIQARRDRQRELLGPAVAAEQVDERDHAHALGPPCGGGRSPVASNMC